jgi:glycosyltransferase involved in cell wall biosynthesis
MPMRFEELRLGFVTDRAAYAGDDGLWIDAGVGRLLSVWAGDCRRLTVAMAASPERHALKDMRLELPPVDFLPLPWMPSVARGFHKIRSCRRAIREVERRSDVVIVQLPFAAPLALFGGTRPRLYHLCGDISSAAKTSTAYRGYRRLPAVLAARTIDSIQRRLVHASDARVVTNGEELLAHYGQPAGRAVVSTTILDAEIMSVRRRRPSDAPFRVLYVGYLGHRKGIDILFDAFEQLLVQVPKAELVVAGPLDVVDRGLAGFVAQRLAQLERKATVLRLEHLNFGPELFQQFADADVLALPSRSEGTPRVLVEARAFGCPVIGTRVGGIPSSVEDGIDGLLIRPDDPRALAEAILRIARDPALRERLVTGGLRRARASTVESFARIMADEIEQLLADSRYANHACAPPAERGDRATEKIT